MTRTRSRRMRVLTAAILLPAIMALAAVAMWPRPSTDAALTVSPVDHAGHEAAISGLRPGPTPVRPSRNPIELSPPPDSPVGDEPGRSLAEAAGPGTQASTREGAAGLGAPRDAVDPAEVAPSARALGGCLAEYGEDGQCLSVIPPSLSGHVQAMRDAGIDPTGMSHPWTCAELRTHFDGGIAVRERGVDPLELDADGDGIACGAGD